jgi:hypothetical protein
MLEVVPREEPLAERLGGVLVGPEPVRELGPVLEALELRLREGVVVGLEWDTEDRVWVTHVPSLNHLSTYG